MSAHTPGPLSVVQPEEWPFPILIVDGDGREIFHERRHAYGTGQESVAEVLAGSCFDNAETRAAAVESNGRQLADAYLWAAAPDLLAALRQITSLTQDDPATEWSVALNQCVAAIAKATGSQP